MRMEYHPYQPPEITNSPSDIGRRSDARRSFDGVVRYLPLYSHWFAIELADLFNNVDHNANVVTMTVNEVPSTLQKEKIVLLCKQIRSLRDLCHANTGYFRGIVREEVYTSLIASFFHNFFLELIQLSLYTNYHVDLVVHHTDQIYIL